MMNKDMKHFDLFGIGIGPFNLSIAALSQGINGLNTAFADAHKSMTWHPGLLLNEARMQTSPLKDMVTAVEPTNPLSFLSYLVNKRKIYAYMAAQMDTISRIEFADYLAWVASRVDNLIFDNPVDAVEFSGDKFLIHSKQGIFTSQHICLGTGKVAHLPACVKPYMGPKCLHASRLALKDRSYQGKTVAVVGGGQTGADVFLNLLQRQWGEPTRVIWISRRPNFQALDEGVFTDQYFTPGYGEIFYGLSEQVKSQEVKHQKLSSDGITSASLNEIYQHLYQERFIKGDKSGDKWNLRPHRTLTKMREQGDKFELTLINGITNCDELLEVDELILCTGFESQIPSYLAPIKQKLDIDRYGQFNLNREFSVAWDGPQTNKVYAVNAGIHSHGILEPQLSLAAWRSAIIINDMLGHDHFDLSLEESIIDWGQQPPVLNKESTIKHQGIK
ncbi:lysine N(6)-hydroxylase/L-ornithine N(5)-oxygenase family protein [Shewanella nanhaiensis]|uniref:SidA/IucD/PvdA family monooxygenase n=1 Tax=Shewanella nanhaiensis TaxID=2864872 RepID=A0ABS7E0X9_9GAMM|nr:SidA/IucD/PvdA family monooxygenase [Shewanella nanhaiensis]MBW8183299.1 SidA/IucD/PvdA family monooxygenase [Shewanella nanhaiensis]